MIKVITNTGNYDKARSLDIKLYKLKDLVAQRLVRLSYCPTALMPAGQLTKLYSTGTWLELYITFVHKTLNSFAVNFSWRPSDRREVNVGPLYCTSSNAL